MDFSTLKALGTIYPINVDKYEEFDDDNDKVIITKMNSVIQQLNRVGKLSNDTVNNWNKVMLWVMNEGLSESVNTRISVLIEQGEFDKILQSALDNINAEIQAFKATVNASLASQYSNTQVDGLLLNKADKSTTYTKTEITNLLSPKADSSNVYTKTQVDASLAGKANTGVSYTKAEADAKYLLTTTDFSNFALKTDVNAFTFSKSTVAGGVSNQAMTAGVDTQMTLSASGMGLPLDSSWATSNWTCPTAGVYEINTNIMINAVANSLSQAKLYLNGALNKFLYSIFTPTANLIGAGTTTTLKLAVGDVLKFYTNNNVTGATIGGSYSSISIKRVG